MHATKFCVMFILFNLHTTLAEYEDLPISRFGSRYLKRWNRQVISFDDAQQSCREYGGSLAIFPTKNEADTLLDLMTIDIRLNIREERLTTHYYWIGLRYDGENKYWVNSANNITIPRSKWAWHSTESIFDDSGTAPADGCQAVKIFWNTTWHAVNTSIVRLRCDTWSSVRSFLCEKADDSLQDYEQWANWKKWSNNNCEDYIAKHSNRSRICHGYNCELKGLPVMKQIKICCDIPTAAVSRGFLRRKFDHRQNRAYEGQEIELACSGGFVHPQTRYQVSVITCENGTSGRGVWSPTLPSYCVEVDCGDPPLGVHARPPVYTGTKFGDVATYNCQPGFRETTKNGTTVTLRCSNNDSWVGLNFNSDTKPVCQPVAYVPMQWKHYPVADGSGNDHCYRLNHLGKTWQQALTTCNGSLLYIEDESEFEFLKLNILEPQAERGVLWLAGKKKKIEERYSWYLSEDLTVDILGYTNWEERGNYSLPHHRDLCIVANYSGGNWKWLNVTCDNKFEFVCKTLQQKRHGVWSEWTEWTACNRRFIRERTHVCNNPEPFCGGDDCVGDVVEKSNCCQEPGEAQYATISSTSITNDTVFLLPGHYFTYKCNYGYQHLDDTTEMNITCLHNGSWSWPGVAPPCTPKVCSDPDNGTHSTYIKTDPGKRFLHQANVNYDCEVGFVAGKTADALRVGQIKCLDGKWNKPPLRCFAKACLTPYLALTESEYNRRLIKPAFTRHLDIISHNSWGRTAADSNTSLFGDKFQYFCKKGYKFNDRIDYNITCSYDGVWRRDQSDIDLHPDSCEPVNCQGSPPQPLTNSFWKSGVDPNNRSVVGKYLDKAHYECIAGYQVHTNVKGDMRVLLGYSFTCGANNDWKDQHSPDYCQPQNCGDPGPGVNIENRVGRTFAYQDTIDYVCRQGYVYNGVITRRRLRCHLMTFANGTTDKYVSWNDSALKCDKVVCGEPGWGNNVTREGEVFDYGSIITYTCIPQHVLLGGGLEKLWLRCTAQGTWNGTAPSCEPAEIASDFSVMVFKPYVALAKWIMSEKYESIITTFNVQFQGLPGYKLANRSAAYISGVPEHITHKEVAKKTTSKSGLIRFYILTRPEYMYKFRLHSETKVSNEPWPDNLPPIEIYTGGGIPFLGSVQERNLPFIIPLHLLPKASKRPTAASRDSLSISVTFDRSMFSEQNGTILGFSIIVKEVHPWHNTEEIMTKEGYHDRYPESLYTWRQLDSLFTNYKYATWPAYYATPICNIFDSSAGCQKKVGPVPSHTVLTNQTSSSIYKDSIYANFSDTVDQFDRKVSFIVGILPNCKQYDENTTCNGPLRRNRRFCVKLRAYNRYGWNDSMCSNVVDVAKELEFDQALVIPTVLAGLPFVIFTTIICWVSCRKWSRQAKESNTGLNALHADDEGELIKTWTMGDKSFEQEGTELSQRKVANKTNQKRKKDQNVEQ